MRKNLILFFITTFISSTFTNAAEGCIADNSNTIVKPKGNFNNLHIVTIKVGNIEENISSSSLRVTFFEEANKEHFPDGTDGRVSFEGFENDYGDGDGICVDSFDGDTATFKVMLPTGTYAIAAYHDKNDDFVLNRVFGWIPTEPFGFSRDARGTFGPPTFDSAKIEIVEDIEVEFDVL